MWWIRHTGGEPTRIVLGGFPPVNCDSMIKRLEYIKDKMDWIRTCVLFEPRGSMDSFGAIVLPPIDKRAEFSLIFMNTLGYMYMCGHATIGVAGALSKLGYIRMEEPETEISYETVAGIVNVRLHVKDSVIEKISVVEPPSFFVKNVIMEPEDPLRYGFSTRTDGDAMKENPTPTPSQINKQIRL